MHPAVSQALNLESQPWFLQNMLQAVWQQILLASSSNISRIQPPYSKATVNTLGPYLWTYFLISALISCNLLSTQCPECKCLEVRSHQNPPITSHLPQNECQSFFFSTTSSTPTPIIFSHMNYTGLNGSRNTPGTLTSPFPSAWGSPSSQAGQPAPVSDRTFRGSLPWSC